MKSIALVIGGFCLCATTALAHESLNANKTPRSESKGLAEKCDPASSSIDLDVNNVRAKLWNGGDFWWGRGGNGGARYEVPKVQAGTGVSKSSIYSGALWFGGNGSSGLKTAGQTYGAGTSDDFWPGPLDTISGSITKEECAMWNRHFKVSSSDTVKFLNGSSTATEEKAIFDWPTNSSPYTTTSIFAPSMAPYKDGNNNGIYDPTKTPATGQTSDFPDFRGDQAIWWVMNDAGNTHTQYKGSPIGLEIQAMAFAFSTNDELNNMTFYNYKIIKRTAGTLDSTFMGVFVDPDLGDYFDDYIGCDADLGVGYVYNGDDYDGTNLGYGANPPALGVDFFQGPTGKDGKKLPMTRFMYFSNGTTGPTIDPSTDVEMYRYLTGSWKTPVRLTYGGTGYNVSSSDYADFAFPGKTDPKGRAEWSEYLVGNTPGDRRFVESSGPFKLVPGAVNNIIIGVVWARASSGGPVRSLQAMLDADFKAQELFNSGFKIVEGPVIPELLVTELDQQLVLNLYNTKVTESYSDTEITGFGKFKYNFEGYQIFQLRDNTVTAADITDDNRAKLIFQCDVKNNVRTIVNKRYNAFTEETVPQVMVQGTDNGIEHSFVVKTDAFNNGLPIVNNQQYYFLVIAYAYSKEARNDVGGVKNQFSAQYLSGIKRANAIANTVTTAIPRKSEPRYDGTQLNAPVGINPKTTRFSGSGNGGNALEFAEETDLSELFSKGIITNPVYKAGSSPLSIRVIDPFKIPDAKFKLEFMNNDFSGPGMDRWMLTNLTTNKVIQSDTTLNISYAQVIPEYGITVAVDLTTKRPGEAPDLNNNGFLTASIEYADPSNQWLQLVKNNKSVYSGQNWIRAFDSGNDKNITTDSLKDQDNNEYFREILEGRICPFKFTERSKGPGIDNEAAQSNVRNNLKTIPSIDLVITPNQDRWSKCIVVDCSSVGIAPLGKKGENNENAGSLRNESDTTGIATGIGRSVFPGYAINMETGERLNVFFAEFSKYKTPIARDMIFNPNMDTVGGFNGGRHYIYVTNTPYDSCNAMHALLSKPSIANPSAINVAKAFGTVGWTMVPLADPSKFLSSEVKIKVRVAKPLAAFDPAAAKGAAVGYPYYEFTTKDLAPVIGNKELAKNSLDMIRVVPNPYYAYSTYEQTKTDSRVRITNLPTSVVISIYNMGGALVKRITKDDENTNYIEWDLRNDNNVPIASGMYIIHVKAKGIGETSLKWFGVMRPIDLDNF